MAKQQLDPLVQMDREIGMRGDLREFFSMAWHVIEPSQPISVGWHTDAQCDHYQAIEEGQIKYLVVNIPPGCSKSRISGVFWPVWAWLQNPGLKWGHFSFDDTNTMTQNRDSLALMRSDWFQARWGDVFSFVSRDPAEGDFHNSKGGRRFASSVEGKATGKHFHRQVIDDPLKPKGISQVTLDGTKKWVTGTLGTRWIHGKTHTARALVMQRLHEDDTTAQLLALHPTAVHLMLPMEYESARACTTHVKKADGSLMVFFHDGVGSEPGVEYSGRKEEGDLLCPQFMTREDVNLLKNGELTSQEVASQLQQNPVAAGGNIFKDANFRFWISERVNGGPVATGRFDVCVPPRLYTNLPARFELMWQSWDFAFRDTKTSDYVVGQVWGRYKNDFFLLSQVRARMDFTASVAAVKQMTALWPKARKKLIEAKANGDAIMASLKGQRGMFGVEAVEPDGGKEARASACSPLFESGNVYFPDPDMAGFEWVRPAIAEMCSFPFAKNDDVVDCASQALNWGSIGFRGVFGEAMANMRNPQAQGMRELVARFR